MGNILYHPTSDISLPHAPAAKITEDSHPRRKQQSASAPAAANESWCAICFGSFDVEGEHRVAALRCGHVFGKECIEDWIRRGNANNHGQQEARCPMCEKKTSLSRVIPLFVSAKTLGKVVNNEVEKELKRLKQSNVELSASNRMLVDENLALSTANGELLASRKELEKRCHLLENETRARVPMKPATRLEKPKGTTSGAANGARSSRHRDVVVLARRAPGK